MKKKKVGKVRVEPQTTGIAAITPNHYSFNVLFNQQTQIF